MSDTNTIQSYTLLQLQEFLRDLVQACPNIKNVWITAELSDVSEHGGHCYMDLLQKDPRTGATVAKARATIWANQWRSIKHRFMAETGQPFASGLTVMVCVTAGYHPLYGMNLNIVAVNPSFTLGERERRRREILQRLKADGIADLNKQTEFPRPCQRIAIVSGKGAAGFGDFINQLANNGSRLRFTVKLFPSLMQGAQTAQGVISALDAIYADIDNWDCVCIIRGGGASADLDGFDDYSLASHVAQFPLPVIVGIGHERDTTVLDYICRQRVKTPTAAAEFLVSMAQGELDLIRSLGGALLQRASDALSGAKQQMAYISAQLPAAPVQALERARRRVDTTAMRLGSCALQALQPMSGRLDRMAQTLAMASTQRLRTEASRLDSHASLLKALSPQAVLQRGYSITRINGHALTDAAQAAPGDVITTELSQGTITSTICQLP